ncbi:MAG: VOC family protein, partial [Streptosporangiaceae bacterium]
VMHAVVRGVDAVDTRLRKRASAEEVAAMRTGLSILAEIKTADRASGAGRRRPAAQLRRFAPIFPVRDLAAALAHYASLGFETSAYQDGDGYGFAGRDGAGLHLEAHSDHGHEDHGHDGHEHDGHEHGASAYLFVRDADALYEEWSGPGIGGHTEPAEDKPWGMHEGTHTDPDGNLIRFGTSITE